MEPIVRENVEQLISFRLWDVSNLSYTKPATNDEEDNKVENGILNPQLEMTYETALPCYKIRIDMPRFDFPLGFSRTDYYSISLAPTGTLEDDHLGNFLRNTDGTFITSLYVGQTLKMDGKEGTFTVKTLKSGENTYTESNRLELYQGNDQKYMVSEGYSKNYPLNVKVLFEQVD